MESLLMMSDKLKEQIDNMTREEMARKWRFAPSGDPMLQSETGTYFQKRFNSLGGFSPAISKKIGWDES